MSGLQLYDRENHYFVSYASQDAALAERLADWLSSAGLRVWLDQRRLTAGAPVLEELTRQICNSRACLFVMTADSLEKSYVKHEVDIACDQQVTQPGFCVLAARIDPTLDPTSRFPALRKLSWMDIPNGELTLQSARALLLSSRPATPKTPGARHVYVSCGWGEGEYPLVRRVCARLAARGVRLIGDAPDQAEFRREGRLRVRRLMSGCTGHLLLLPDRRPPGKAPEETYKYFIAEWEIGRELGLCRRTFCIEREVLPAQLRDEAIVIPDPEDASGIDEELMALHDETEPGAPHVFLATDYKHNASRNEAARDVIEHVLGMECRLGQDYPAEQLREAIVGDIASANCVIADLACRRDPATNRLAINLNTSIEAGIAAGARRPVFVTAYDPGDFDPEVRDKTTQIPFMFRNSQVLWYRSDIGFLAEIHRLALSMRRRIINDELDRD